MIAKQRIANIWVQEGSVCWVQIHSWLNSWVEKSSIWRAVYIWKAVFIWQVISSINFIECCLVVCYLISIIYFSELACILRCIIWTITIVIVNYICTAVSRCTLTLGSADWSSWAVRSISAGTCRWIYCWENSLIWTEVWVVNNSTVARISNIGTCICRWNKNSTIYCWIIIWCCGIAICIRDTILRGIIICGEKSIIGCLSCCYKLIAIL